MILLTIVIFIIYAAAAINFTAITLLVGWIWFGFGSDWLANHVSTILLTLLVTSSLWLIGLEIVRRKLKKKSKVATVRARKEIETDWVTKEFLIVKLEMAFKYLSREEIKKFAIDYVCATQDLINELGLLEKIEN